MTLLGQRINFKDGSTTYYINDRASIDSHWTISPFYYVKLDSTEGWHSTDIESESHPIPHGIGEVSGTTYRRGKGFALSGTVFAKNITYLKAAAIYLRQAFWTEDDRTLVYTITSTNDAYVICRIVNDISITENFQDYYVPRLTWTVGLRADDPRPRKVSDNTLFYSWMT